MSTKKTRALVQTAIKALDYTAKWNSLTALLFNKHSKLIGVLVPHLIQNFAELIEKRIINGINKTGFHPFSTLRRENEILKYILKEQQHEKKTLKLNYINNCGTTRNYIQN